MGVTVSAILEKAAEQGVAMLKESGDDFVKVLDGDFVVARDGGPYAKEHQNKPDRMCMRFKDDEKYWVIMIGDGK